MKQVVLAIVLATALSGCYIGVRSPIYGGFEPPVVVEHGPPVVQGPPGAYIAPPFYPYILYGPYGYWGGGWYGRNYYGRGYYGYYGQGYGHRS
jgi:hypothetical protein